MPNQVTSLLPGGPTGLGSLDPLGQPGLDRKGADSERNRLIQAAVEVESLFLGKLLEQMRRAMVDPLRSSPQESRGYQAIVDQQLARTLAATGGMGLARRLVEDLAPPEPPTQQENHHEGSTPQLGKTDPPAGDRSIPTTPRVPGRGMASPHQL